MLALPSRLTSSVAAALGKDPWGTDLLMPRILEAVKAHATVSEIIGVLREVWGEYTEPNITYHCP
jgi:methylmalonyl-CoA mutase N-terminal domain/subunit